MERRPVSESPAPRYPSYDEFHANRRKFLQVIGLGASVAALGGLTSGCQPEEPSPALGGVTVVCPEPPPPMLDGEMAVAVPDPAPQLDGDISIAELPQLRGSMPVPAPPAPEPPAPRPTPRPPGAIKPPLPALGGVMIAPDPAS